jgi:hypothetical protein
VFKTLCGGLDASELAKHHQDKKNSPNLARHSMNFLRALTNEPVVLEWTIGKRLHNSNCSSGPTILTKVVLKSLS